MFKVLAEEKLPLGADQVVDCCPTAEPDNEIVAPGQAVIGEVPALTVNIPTGLHSHY